jgi:hypothetical protein
MDELNSFPLPTEVRNMIYKRAIADYNYVIAERREHRCPEAEDFPPALLRACTQITRQSRPPTLFGRQQRELELSPTSAIPLKARLRVCSADYIRNNKLSSR